MGIRGKLIFVGRLTVVLLIYIAIGRSVSLPQITMELSTSLVYGLAGAVMLTLGQAAVCNARWHSISREVPNRPGFRVSFLAYAEGLFINQALPSVIGGDAWRVVRWREHDVSVMDAMISVLIDRVFGLFGAALLASGACALLWRVDYPAYWLGAVAVGTVAILAGCSMVFAVMYGGHILAERWLSGRWSTLAVEIRRFRLDMPTLLACLLASVVGQVLSGLGVVAIARTLDVSLDASLLVTVTSLIALLSMIPISLAGWGIREAGFVAILVPLGVPAEKAILIGVFFGLQGLLASLAGGISLLLGLAAPADRLPGKK